MHNEICDFSPFHTKLYEDMVALTAQDSLFQINCIMAAAAFQKPSDNAQQILEVTHQAQRLAMIFQAGLQSSPEFFKALEETTPVSWRGYEGVDVAPEMHKSLAEKLYNVNSPDDLVTFIFGDKSKEVAALLMQKAVDDKVKFFINIEDRDFMSLIFNHCDENGAKAMGEASLQANLPATKRIVTMTLMPEHKAVIELSVEGKSHKAIYEDLTRSIKEKAGRGEMLSTLTFIPTRAEASVDLIPYKDYTRLFFEMCDQPWEHISDAQKFLIEKFNKASHARFTNEWGTDIKMELMEWKNDMRQQFTFCNSLIAKNVPGSEVFSAPRRDSVNGRIVSYGRFNSDHSDKIIENLRLHFTNGCLDTWGAEKGVEHFNKFIERDPNNRYVGELGIGTNPHLKQHVVNGLLVEKIGGSFHLALGYSYEMTDYLGDPVHVDNGNRSKDHWDITTMLHGAGGRIYLDGKMIMDNGAFLDPKLDVLNRGWNALPQAERPEYWQKHSTPFSLTV